MVDTPVLGMTSLPFDSSSLAADTPLSLGIRPEHVSLKAAQGTAGVVVTGVEYLGSETYVHLDTGQDEPLICRCEVNSGWQVGDQVELQLEFGNLHLFDADGTALKRHPHAIESLPDGVSLSPVRARAL
ncbi:maltose/maltodextrin transporter ATP-binding protein [compost metagenome]